MRVLVLSASVTFTLHAAAACSGTSSPSMLEGPRAASATGSAPSSSVAGASGRAATDAGSPSAMGGLPTVQSEPSSGGGGAAPTQADGGAPMESMVRREEAGNAALPGSAGSSGASGEPPANNTSKDGDPNSPVVTVDGLPCGGMTSGTVMIGDRDVTVDYPCDKHEGAQVTVLLNLHGTLIGGAPYLYQHAYFSAHTLANSHNLIVLTPESSSRASLGAQWGNMDDGADVPHLLAVIDWAYKTFASFQIRSLWLGGHSWGSRFISGSEHPVGEPFACNAMIADKVKGVIGMSHLRMPTCASRLAMISTRGQEEDIPLLDQTAVAAEHGCMTPAGEPTMLGNNRYLHFTGCGNGWAHEDYEMLGKGHIDNIDTEIVKNIIETIKKTELP